MNYSLLLLFSPIRMVLAGFSQGGALSLFTGLQLETSLAGILVLSGYLPAASKMNVKHTDTPVWHGHGSMVRYLCLDALLGR
jgi:predicted esterase